MTDEFQTDATKALAEIRGVIASLPADIAKVKAFWTDYRVYFVAVLCLIVGAILGHKL